MNLNLPDIALACQLLTAILALFFIQKFRNDFYYILVSIFLLTAIVELLGYNNVLLGRSGMNLYFVYGFVLFNLISIFYYRVLSFKKKKALVCILSVFFNIGFFVIIGREGSLSTMVILGSINTSVYIFQYLRELLLSDRILNYRKHLVFWVSVGFLVFYLPSIPFFSMFSYMSTRGLFFILSVLIILMNLIIIYGLICSKKEKY